MLLSFNSLFSRMASSIATTFDGERRMYETLGYPKIITFQNCWDMYHRQDIAHRIIKTYPEATWRDTATVFVDNGSESNSFGEEWEALSNRLCLPHYLTRLDILQSIGRYSLLLLLTSDVSNEEGLKEPVDGLNSPDDVLGVQAYSEGDVQISSYDNNVFSPRHGLPDTYRLTTGSHTHNQQAGASMPTKTLVVHHSRILHVAEGTLTNDVFGTPTLECVYNRLIDLEKLLGGASESFWLNARGGTHFDIDMGAEFDSEKEKEKMKKDIEAYVHNLTRFMITKGVAVNPVNFAVHSNEHQVSAVLDSISSATGIPKRILIGSERGELASSQDESNFKARIAERRSNFAEAMILRPLIERFIEWGVLPDVGEFVVDWGEDDELTPVEKADIGLKQAQALAAYANPLGALPEQIVGPEQFVTDVLGMEYKPEDVVADLDQ